MDDELGTLRLYLLRAMYLLIAVGLGLSFWPLIVAPPDGGTGTATVVRALLGALAVMAALGVRYPVRMIPILLFELLWKVVWVFAFALPAWRRGGLDPYATETLVACVAGLVLVPPALPWGHVIRQYVRGPGERWRSR